MISRSSLVVALALALAAACTSTSASEPAPRTGPVVRPRVDHGYPMDDVLRINHVQVRATHNSYHVQTPGSTPAEWQYTHLPLDAQLETQGVRGVELDIRYVTETNRFEVFHIPALDEQTTCRTFTACLAAIKSWSDGHLGHTPIFIQIEPKEAPPPDDEAEAYFAKLEAEVLSVWPRERIVAPDDVQGDAPTLRDAVTTRGWPTLGTTRGTILFYVDNVEVWRTAYTRGGKSLAGRLMFVDSPDTDPLAAFLVINEPKDRAKIDAAARAGFLVRTRADGAGFPEEHDAALATGAHALSCDAPTTLAIPGGTPSRCNPVSAPAGCIPSAIEEPSHLR